MVYYYILLLYILILLLSINSYIDIIFLTWKILGAQDIVATVVNLEGGILDALRGLHHQIHHTVGTLSTSTLISTPIGILTDTQETEIEIGTELALDILADPTHQTDTLIDTEADLTAERNTLPLAALLAKAKGTGSIALPRPSWTTTKRSGMFIKLQRILKSS